MGSMSYLSKKEDVEDAKNENSDKDIFESSSEENNHNGVGVGRRISFSSAGENNDAGDEIKKAANKSKASEIVKTEAPSESKASIDANGMEGDEKKVLKRKQKNNLMIFPKASSEKLQFATNKKRAFNKRTNDEIFDDTTEDLDRGYNEAVLKRDGSPEISSKLKAPEPPAKRRGKKSKAEENLVKKNIAEKFDDREKVLEIKYSMENLVIIGKLGEIFNLQEPTQGDQGDHVLDKAAKEMVSSYRCGFWPLCGGLVSSNDSMVRGGVLVEPQGHNKINQFV